MRLHLGVVAPRKDVVALDDETVPAAGRDGGDPGAQAERHRGGSVGAARPVATSPLSFTLLTKTPPF